MSNRLVLYCDKFSRASYWDVCKKRRCGENCLFSNATAKIGRDDLFSPVPKRYSSVEEIERDLPVLTEPIRRKAVPPDQSEAQLRRPALITNRKEKAPEKSEAFRQPKELPSYSDLVKEAVKKAFAEGRDAG
jgi:hypothetical protein